jgi:hypothetical protein
VRVLSIALEFHRLWSLMPYGPSNTLSVAATRTVTTATKIISGSKILRDSIEKEVIESGSSQPVTTLTGQQLFVSTQAHLYLHNICIYI